MVDPDDGWVFCPNTLKTASLKTFSFIQSQTFSKEHQRGMLKTSLMVQRKIYLGEEKFLRETGQDKCIGEIDNEREKEYMMIGNTKTTDLIFYLILMTNYYPCEDLNVSDQTCLIPVCPSKYTLLCGAFQIFLCGPTNISFRS